MPVAITNPQPPGISATQGAESGGGGWISGFQTTLRLLAAVGDGVPTVGGIIKAVAGAGVILLEQVELTRQNKEESNAIASDLIIIANVLDKEARGDQLSATDFERSCTDLKIALTDMTIKLMKLQEDKKGVLSKLKMKKLDKVISARRSQQTITAIKQQLDSIRLSLLISTTSRTRAGVEQAIAKLDDIRNTTTDVYDGVGKLAGLVGSNQQATSDSLMQLTAGMSTLVDTEFRTIPRGDFDSNLQHVKLRLLTTPADRRSKGEDDSVTYYHGTVGSGCAVKTVCVYRGPNAYQNLAKTFGVLSNPQLMEDDVLVHMFGVCRSEHWPAIVLHEVLIPYAENPGDLITQSSVDRAMFEAQYWRDQSKIYLALSRAAGTPLWTCAGKIFEETIMFDVKSRRLRLVDLTHMPEDFTKNQIELNDILQYPPFYWLLDPMSGAGGSRSRSSSLVVQSKLSGTMASFYYDLYHSGHHKYLSVNEFPEDAVVGDIFLHDGRKLHTKVAAVEGCSANKPQRVLWRGFFTSYVREEIGSWTRFVVPLEYNSDSLPEYRIVTGGISRRAALDAGYLSAAWFVQAQGVIDRSRALEYGWEASDFHPYVGRQVYLDCAVKLKRQSSDDQAPKPPNELYFFIRDDPTLPGGKIPTPTVVWSLDPYVSPCKDSEPASIGGIAGYFMEREFTATDDYIIQSWSDFHYDALTEYHEKCRSDVRDEDAPAVYNLPTCDVIIGPLPTGPHYTPGNTKNKPVRKASIYECDDDSGLPEDDAASFYTAHEVSID